MSEILKNTQLNNAVITAIKVAGPFQGGKKVAYIDTSQGKVKFTIWPDNPDHPFKEGQILNGMTSDYGDVKADFITGEAATPHAGASPSTPAYKPPTTSSGMDRNKSIEIQSICKQVIDLYGVVGAETGIPPSDTETVASWVADLTLKIHGKCFR